MTQEEVAIFWKDANGWDVSGYKNTLEDLERFAKLIAKQAQIEMQDRINTLHAMYEQACKQRDELMDAQRSMVAAMRGQMQ